MRVRRWLGVSLVVTGLFLVAGSGCNSDTKTPKVEGNKLELKPLPPPGSPGGGQKAKGAPSPQ